MKVGTADTDALYAAVRDRLATTPDALAALDVTDLLEGYADGRANDPQPGPNRSASYVHGWWCGMRDGKHREAHPIDGVIVRAEVSRPDSPIRIPRRTTAG